MWLFSMKNDGLNKQTIKRILYDNRGISGGDDDASWRTSPSQHLSSPGLSCAIPAARSTKIRFPTLFLANLYIFFSVLLPPAYLSPLLSSSNLQNVHQMLLIREESRHFVDKFANSLHSLRSSLLMTESLLSYSNGNMTRNRFQLLRLVTLLATGGNAFPRTLHGVADSVFCCSIRNRIKPLVCIHGEIIPICPSPVCFQDFLFN